MEKFTQNELKHIAENFAVPGKFVSGRKFGNGHINDSFLVEFSNSHKKKYILRRINHNVFKKPEIVVSNSITAVNHIKQKLIKEGIANYEEYVLTFIETKEKQYYHKDINENYWCLTLFFEDYYTVEFVKNASQAYSAAKAFGKFQKQLSDVPLDMFKPTIPDFHNLAKRMLSYYDVLGKNPMERAQNAEDEIIAIKNFLWIAADNSRLKTNFNIPTRITHNDTKINNVMLHKETNEGLCVIDLDTVMPGTVLFDFGDMVRTSTSPVAEDEKDISKVTMQIDIFEALVKGYMSELKPELTQDEVSNLVFGAYLIVFEQAVRFLTDYLAGDVYYNIDYPEHNLVRTKNQLALLKSIDKQSSEMKKIVDRIALYGK
jgi:hypothetical protein